MSLFPVVYDHDFWALRNHYFILYILSPKIFDKRAEALGTWAEFY